MMTNQQWLINGNPLGRELRSTDFKRVDVELPELCDRQLRIKVDYLEFTPSLKGQMENRLAYAEKTESGQVMRGRGIGTVIESADEQVKVGDKVHGYLGWQKIATLDVDQVTKRPDDKYLRYYLGPLGSSGMAAYFGLFDVGKPVAGDTVLISGAAGAVGSMVGQMAKLSGCRVIGVAGGPTKCAHLTEHFKLDAAIDYQNEDLASRLKELAPDGVNVVFDNVGGDFLECALGRLHVGARVVICGAITRYSVDTPPPGPSNYFNLVHKRANMQGVLSVDYKDRFPQAVEQIHRWLDTGEFVYLEDIQQGFENIPATFMRLFTGENLGKQLIQL